MKTKIYADRYKRLVNRKADNCCNFFRFYH